MGQLEPFVLSQFYISNFQIPNPNLVSVLRIFPMKLHDRLTHTSHAPHLEHVQTPHAMKW